MVLSNEILSPNHRAIFARCLDSQLRFVPQVIAGLSLPSDSYILFGSASSDEQRLCAGLRAGAAPKSE
jgi:hypothetical protein